MRSTGYPYTFVYSASKAAVAALTESLNVELAPFGIAVKAVFPSKPQHEDLLEDGHRV